MVRERNWGVSVQGDQYRAHLYEFKWWHRYVEFLAEMLLGVGTRIPHPGISEKICSASQRLFQVAYKGEILIATIDITKEKAREIAPDFVEIFDDSEVDTESHVG